MGSLERCFRIAGRYGTALGLALGLLFTPQAARSWGAEGHRTVALIAMNHLKAGARAQIENLLQVNGTATIADAKVHATDFKNIADMASWADAYRFNHRDSEGWHFVDIPITARTYDELRDCGNLNCVVAKIALFRKVLADATANPADRAVALRFIVHFVGDVHQPLHSADNDDRGGNSVNVVFNRQPSNLHHAWDTELVLAAGGRDQTALSARLDQSITNEDNQIWSAGTVEDWANEAHTQAVDVAYGKLPQSRAEDLQDVYSAVAIPVVEMQLKRAGIRLAFILNDALK